MNAEGYPPGPPPRPPHERNRFSNEGLDHNFSPRRPESLYTNQQMRPGLSRGHGTYGGTPNQPIASQPVASQLYPQHLQSLAHSSFTQPYPQAREPNGSQAPVYSPAVQVNRVTTLPAPLPHGNPHHVSYRQESPYTPPPPFSYMDPPAPAPAPAEFAPIASYAPPPPAKYQPTVEHGKPIFQQSPPALGSPPLQPHESAPGYEYGNPPPQGEDPPPESPNDEAELALAIELSQKMVLEQQQREKELRRQEDEEFERALAQSMLETTGSYSYTFEEPQGATSSKVTLDSPRTEWIESPTQSSPSAGNGSSPGLNGTSVGLSGVAAGKQPAPLNDHDASATPPTATSMGNQEVDPDHPLPITDGDLSPVLFQEEPEKVFRDRKKTLMNFASHADPVRSPSPLQILSTFGSAEGSLEEEQLPIQSVIIPEAIPTSTGPSNLVPLLLDRSESPSELAYYNESRPLTPLPPQQNDTAEQMQVQTNELATSHSGRSEFSATSASPIRASPTHPRNPRQPYYSPKQIPPENDTLPLERVSSRGSLQKYQAIKSQGVLGLPSGAAPAAPQVMAASQYIDPDLLMGVSIDFKDPVLSAQMGPMAGPLPNIVSLPYGRCLPLHIQAPSWRHLLKLLARMGNTKFDMTDAAKVALRNSDAKLRTIVQFIKIHPTAEDWRTVLWFSLDHAVPPSLPHASKYINPHPSVFPFSYELINVSRLLRNAADSPMSKTYTIPASESLPYPTIPMTFPNLALYLQAALDFSRQQKDDSNGYRGLAKMVQTCYPHMEESSEPSEKKTVGGLFKRVIGRGNNKKKTGKTNNEETYEYITPFVPDEWG